MRGLARALCNCTGMSRAEAYHWLGDMLILITAFAVADLLCIWAGVEEPKVTVHGTLTSWVLAGCWARLIPSYFGTGSSQFCVGVGWVMGAVVGCIFLFSKGAF